MDQRIINLALSFDLVIFGGYIRDVEVCGGTRYNDIDILWPNTTDRASLFEKFMRILELDNPGRVSKKVMDRSHYGTSSVVIRVVVGDVSLDMVMYDGSVEDWMSTHDVDFSCNLFYKTRTVQLGIRYIPKCFEDVPNPVQTIIDLTKSKKFRGIVEKAGDSVWRRAANRGFDMVCARGWVVEGEFLGSYAEDRVWDMSTIMAQKLEAIKATQVGV
jgi:hypothetical protein